MNKRYLLGALILGACLPLSADRFQPDPNLIKNCPAIGSVSSRAKSQTQTSPESDATQSVSTDDIGGNYDWTFNSLIKGNGNSGELLISVTNPERGEVVISGFYMDMTVKAYIDSERGTLTIPNKQDLGKDGQGYQNYFYLKQVNSKGQLIAGVLDQEASVGKFDKDGRISFPENDIWAIGDYDNEQSGFWILTKNNILSKKKASNPDDPNDGWTSLGYATLQDGWVLPGLGINQLDPQNWYEVELQQNDDNKNIYRLVDPYKGNCPVKDKNTATNTGYIQFNVTYPDFVTFDVINSDEHIDAGFTCSSLGIAKMFCSNMVTYWCNKFNLTLETFINEYSYSPTFKTGSTFKDGIITLPAEKAFTVGYYNDASFGYPGDPKGGGQWLAPNSSTRFVNMETKIFFPESAGVSDVCVDNESSEIEYFNLQGVKITDPSKGQLLIRRQGDKTDKIVFTR